MNGTTQFLALHGYWFLIGAGLGRQACLPIPANLFLVAAGALARSGRRSLFATIGLSVMTFLLADLEWYDAGLSYRLSWLSLRGPNPSARRNSGPCELTTFRQMLAGVRHFDNASRLSRVHLLVFESIQRTATLAGQLPKTSHEAKDYPCCGRRERRF